MFPPLLSSLICTVLALTASAFWGPAVQHQHVKQVRGGGSDNHNSVSWLISHTIEREKSSSTELVSLHTSKCLSPSPTLQYQGINVTKVVPIYELCSLPQAKSITCSKFLETLTTMTCSTVLTGFFTKITITDCKQNITFSSQSSYSVAKISATQTAILASGSPSSYVQEIVSYYIAPWQSLAAGTLSDVAVLICKTDNIGRVSCKEILEVLVVHTAYVPVKATSTISVSQSFASSVLLMLGHDQNITASGEFSFSTQIIYSSMSPITTTITSIIDARATRSDIKTIWVTESGHTITKTLKEVSTPTL